jgi:LysM repeat protein
MGSYTVKSGDTLSSIGANQGVDWKSITGYKSGNPSLIYPGEVLSWGAPAPASAPSTPAPVSNTNTAPAAGSSQALTGELTNFDSTAQNPIDIYNSALEKLGITDARTRVTNLRKSLTDNQSLLDNLSGNIQGRTANSLVTEAQRQRLQATESAPIVDMGNKLNQQFGLAQGDYTGIMNEGKTQADMTIQGQTAKRSALLDRLKLAIDSETDIEKKRQWQATYDQAKAQNDRTFTESQRQFNISSAQKSADSAKANAKPTLEQGLNQLGTTFKNGSNYARFYTGENTWLTREQAGYQLANEVGITYEEAMKAINGRYKTSEGK